MSARGPVADAALTQVDAGTGSAAEPAPVLLAAAGGADDHGAWTGLAPGAALTDLAGRRMHALCG